MLAGVRTTARRPGLILFSAVALALTAPAAARADAVWTGASTSTQWSVATNWTGTTPPTTAGTAAGTIVFPQLGSCGTCYASDDNLTGISATGLSFGNTSSQYQLSGDSLTVGTGGISDTQGGATGNVISAPLVLSGPQPWAVGSTLNGYNSLTLLGGISGSSASAVTVSTPRGDLFVDSDMEVGPVTSNGPNGLHIGGAPGLGRPGSINGTDGQPLTITGGSLVINPGSSSGPLTVNGGTLLLGTNPTNTGTTTLHVNGPASLGTSTTTSTFIDANGSTPGTSFSQLSSTGNMTIGGQLTIGQGQDNGTCETLSAGDVATLATTTGTLSGTYANAPQGATLTLAGPCQSTRPQVQIHYADNSVTATVVGAAPVPTTTTTTTALATPAPPAASTNQAVTLTATVRDSTVAPAGTVAFTAGAAPIPGCGSQPLGPGGTATCVTSFAASSSPESLTATFTGSSGSGQAGSTSPAQTLTVDPSSTASGVTVSGGGPATAAGVTYTATVTPVHTGPISPTGTIRFLDAGQPITGCAAQPLMAGSPSSTATCTLTYPATGAHTITAAYGGDINFAASNSVALTVTVQATPTPTPSRTTTPTPNPTPSPTPTPTPTPTPHAASPAVTTSAATRLTTTRARLAGTVATGGAAVTWHFAYGRTAPYGRSTPSQTIAADHSRPVSVSATLSHLDPDIRYHFRLVAIGRSTSNATVAAVRGRDRTFTTRATGTLSLDGATLRVTRTTVLVGQTCDSGVHCRGRLSITTTPRTKAHAAQRTVLCASSTFSVRAHRRATVRARLTAACRMLLRDAKAHRLAAHLLARPLTGQRPLTRRVVLRPG